MEHDGVFWESSTRQAIIFQFGVERLALGFPFLVPLRALDAMSGGRVAADKDIRRPRFSVSAHKAPDRSQPPRAPPVHAALILIPLDPPSKQHPSRVLADVQTIYYPDL